MKEPDLSLFDPCFGDSPREAWEARDWAALHMLLNQNDRATFVRDNVRPLKDAGMFESMLFEAYLHGPHMPPMNWAMLFSHADFTTPDERWTKPAEPITVFRGIAHDRHRKWIRGLSWTTNPATAAWFALRFSAPGRTPAVYSLTADPMHVYFTTNQRGEEEAVIAAWNAGKLKRLDPMPPPVKPV
jgi:hypothetical protein